MSSLSISLLTLACVFGAALFGLFLNSVLPQNYLDEGSRDTVKLMTGLMATLSALVLGLLIASAKSSYDRTNQQFQQIAVEIVLIDHALAAYGPETKDVRTQLVATYKARIDQLFPGTGTGTARDPLHTPPRLMIEDVETRLRTLLPASDAQRAHMTRALQLIGDVTLAGWLLTIEQAEDDLPAPMLGVLISWLVAMFLGFGLVAPRKATTVLALLIGALAVSTSIFLIEEMTRPLDGIIAISAAPMRDAISYLGR